ncbi:ABC transporter substrate-binding protein [Chromobacterium sp. IIBBL 290-4]|uniref:substrate-binding periplasmic protein n=1 Tax=Chromobacterium sp. IIBBL 290-4 TaxID=2953890 RepID=UPI0020B8E920|nr:transporter substrate-binding domain-containing protein [Chromobacterium sp. IIBBL 290-4]UTH76125.1 transporter substrate-binding domain-containing protein [Chromobacterium sp. IIBBL 290-4]
MKRLLSGLLLLLWLSLASAQPIVLRVCHEDAPSYPWLLENGRGLSQIMLTMVADKLGIAIQNEAMPWVRCMLEVKSGRMDGLYKISFSPERQELGVFPMKNGQPDAALRMLTDSYSLYRLKDSALAWDGHRIEGAGKGIAAQAGFSIVNRLQQMGLPVDSSSRNAAVILHKVLLGRVSGAALQSREADDAIAAEPALQGKLDKLEPPLATKPYYLIFSHAFYQRQPDRAHQVWDAIAAVRASPAYLAAKPGK